MHRQLDQVHVQVRVPVPPLRALNVIEPLKGVKPERPNHTPTLLANLGAGRWPAVAAVTWGNRCTAGALAAGLSRVRAVAPADRQS